MDPLAELAPTDPTWNPANTVPPEAMVAAQDPAQNIPPTQQSMDVNTAPPSDQMATVSTPMTAPIPSETAPNNPDIERHFHEANWRKILDKVGTILGGDQTIHVKKDTDGNVTITHDPSTSGEKWGRIAATALGGAATGIANSQGPGGAVRAAAAGTSFGLQQPQQRQQEADQQATAEQKRMQGNANNALLQQRLYNGMLEGQALNTKLTGDQATMFQEYQTELANSPNSKDYGTIKGPDDLMKVARDNQDFLKHHMNLQLKVMPVPDGKGGIALHAVAIDPGDDAQPTAKGDYLFTLDADPKTGEPILGKTEISPGSMRQGQRRLANQALQEKFMTVKNAYQKSLDDKTKSERERVPTTSVQAMAAAALEKDPEKKAQLEEAAQKMAREEEKQKTLGRSPTIVNTGYTPPPAGSPPHPTTTKSGAPIWGQAWGGGDANSAFENTSRQLALGEKTEGDIPKRYAKGQPAPQDYSNRARQISEDLFGPGTEYNPAQIQKEYKFANTEKVQAAYNAMDRLAGNPSSPDPNHPPLLDQLEAAAQAAGVSETAPWNEIKLAVQRKLGNAAAKALEFDLAEVRKSLAQVTGNPTLGSSDTNLKLQQMSESYGGDITLAGLRKVNREAKAAIETERASGFRNNRFLRRDYGGEAIVPGQQTPAAAAPGTDTSQAARQPGAPAAQSYPVYSDGKGKFIQWDGKQYATVPAPTR